MRRARWTMSTEKSADELDANQPVAVLVFCSYPLDADAEGLARVLLERRLAGSVNILPAGRSLFNWDGEVRCASEHQLVIKTLACAYPAVETVIREHHPYELPSILCVPIATGYAPYLQWIDAMVRTSA